ncbi:MAG: cupin domain-containing protein [Candidatus Koribacter versatilis]|uniref:Cupin domain-containing protein n=1 Tax=Candidatus Korobacter versatilis TaxID=658062 RepID=A0A932EQ62_9BACT|nr:cupin domain-containing protein [Candidatus Koribacter versatilis]
MKTQGTKKDDHKVAPMADHKIVQPQDIQWGDPPPVLPAGGRMAVLSGDPAKPGIFVIRLKAPDGYRINPHWHPAAEYATVISGTFIVGMGDKWDDKAMMKLGPGSYVSLNAKTRHYATTKGETIVQVVGMGPFVLNYVDPKDDPTKKAAAAKPAAAPAKKK